MKKLDDFLASARTIHDRYAAGRMEREIVRLWVLGLGDYPVPHGPAVADAKAWFRQNDVGADPIESKAADLRRLHRMFAPS